MLHAYIDTFIYSKTVKEGIEIKRPRQRVQLQLLGRKERLQNGSQRQTSAMEDRNIFVTNTNEMARRLVTARHSCCEPLLFHVADNSRAFYRSLFNSEIRSGSGVVQAAENVEASSPGNLEAPSPGSLEASKPRSVPRSPGASKP